MSKNISLKNVPESIYEAIKDRAKQNNRSVNKEIRNTLEESLRRRSPQEVQVILRLADATSKKSRLSIDIKDLKKAINSGRP